MADWYLDLTGGNDANAGTSFALRKKTWNSIAGTAIAAGDTCRVMKTPDAYALNSGGAITGAWTDGSATVTLSAAVTKNVDACDTAWTAGTGITMGTTSAASTAFREGTAANSLIVGGTYVLDSVAAYKTFASADFSAYQLLNIIFQSSAAAAAGDWVVRLCSDTAGATPVCSFNLPAIAATSYANAIVIDFGGLMTGATAIQSVSIVRHLGSGTPTVTFDNIFCSLPLSSAGCLTLQHVIGKNTDPATTTTGVKEWFAIQSINGTTIKLAADCYHALATQTIVPKIATETVNLWAQEVILIPTLGQIWSGKSGSATGGNISIVGGYNTSDMTSITGETLVGVNYYCGANIYILGFENSNYITLQNLGFYGADRCLVTGTSTAASNSFWTVTSCKFIGAYKSALTYLTANVMAYWTITNCYFQTGTNTNSFGVIINGTTYVSNCRFQGSYGTSASGALCLGRGNPSIVNNCFIAMSAGVGYYCYGNSTYAGIGDVVIRNTVFWGSTVADVYSVGGSTWLDNCALNGSVEVTVDTALYGNQGLWVNSTNHDQTANNHQQWHDGGKIISDATTRHTASGIAWKLSPTSTVRTSAYPLKTVIAKIYCVASSQVTISAFFAKDHASTISAGLFVPGGQLGGPASDTTVLTTVNGSSTYESTATTTNWTPTSAGVVEVYAIAYGGTTNNAWVDDFSAVQA